MPIAWADIICRVMTVYNEWFKVGNSNLLSGILYLSLIDLALSNIAIFRYSESLLSLWLVRQERRTYLQRNVSLLTEFFLYICWLFVVPL